MMVGKKSKTIAANRKLVSGKLLLTTTKSVQNELLHIFPEAKSLKDSSNLNDNNIGLPSIRIDREPKTAAANKKLASSKLLSTLTKYTLEIR